MNVKTQPSRMCRTGVSCGAGSCKHYTRPGLARAIEHHCSPCSSWSFAVLFFFYKEYWAHLLFLFNIESSELPE